MPDTRPGTDAYRDLLARFLHETYSHYEPETLEWPALDDGDLARLRSLPVWDEAVTTECRTARLVTAFADTIPERGLREAMALQGAEEDRHARLLDFMVTRYAILARNGDDGATPDGLDWEFLRIGFGECLDSFFAFGLYEVARRSRLFPPALVAIGDRILQEEARHIIFFASWVAHERALSRGPFRVLGSARRMAALLAQVCARAWSVLGVEKNSFMDGHGAIELDITPRAFVDLCLAENERRLALYDERLARPRFASGIARRLRVLLPGETLPRSLPVVETTSAG
ncbi:MAG TPA: ferritin-like domain-containing protein [Planctomycetota bacterium]|nr:ferritin-like domain-containing protein [Planctomycetota bacterium]